MSLTSYSAHEAAARYRSSQSSSTHSSRIRSRSPVRIWRCGVNARSSRCTARTSDPCRRDRQGVQPAGEEVVVANDPAGLPIESSEVVEQLFEDNGAFEGSQRSPKASVQAMPERDQSGGITGDVE